MKAWHFLGIFGAVTLAALTWRYLRRMRRDAREQPATEIRAGVAPPADSALGPAAAVGPIGAGPGWNVGESNGAGVQGSGI